MAGYCSFATGLVAVPASELLLTQKLEDAKSKTGSRDGFHRKRNATHRRGQVTALEFSFESLISAIVYDPLKLGVLVE
jgi:hypothetical protein